MWKEEIWLDNLSNCLKVIPRSALCNKIRFFVWLSHADFQKHKSKIFQTVLLLCSYTCICYIWYVFILILVINHQAWQSCCLYYNHKWGGGECCNNKTKFQNMPLCVNILTSSCKRSCVVSRTIFRREASTAIQQQHVSFPALLVCSSIIVGSSDWVCLIIGLPFFSVLNHNNFVLRTVQDFHAW